MQPSSSPPAHKATLILWGSLLFTSSFMFPGLLFFLQQNPNTKPAVSEQLPLLRMALFGLAAMVAVTSFVLPSLIKKQSQMPAQPLYILRFAMCEAIAIFGLVLGLMGEVFQTAAFFFGAALLLMLLHFPKQGEF